MTNSFVFVMIVLSLVIPLAFADDTIPITLTSGADKIEFDGKWSNELEWKPTSLYELKTTGETIYLRAAHQENFVYFMIDAVVDITPMEGKDSATICFDTKNDKSMVPNTDDYCFISTLGSNSGLIIKGNSESGYVDVDSVKGFIAVGSVSDHNDRYSKVPHSSYEFKIPTALIGRSDNYGFYFSVNDYENKQYFWPTKELGNKTTINTPHQWGNLVSPDKSLPEFNIITVALFGSLVLVFAATRFFKPKSTYRL